MPPAPRPPQKRLTLVSLAGKMGSPPHLPKPGMMKHSEPRKAEFHKPPTVQPPKPRPPKASRPGSPLFGKPALRLPESMAGKLKPLSSGRTMFGARPGTRNRGGE